MMEPSLARLAESVRTLEDDREIRNLLNLIAKLSDSGEVDEWLGCWTEDCSWELEDKVHRGHDAIRNRIQEARSAHRAGPGANRRHVVANQIVHVDGSDQATSEQYMIYLADVRAKAYVLAIYEQSDTLRRTPDGWKLARRRAARA